MQVSLRRVFDGLETATVRVEGLHLLIGRGNDCHLRPASPHVSRRHCEIVVEGQRVTVRDLASTNGTYVNCQRVEDTRELTSRDVLGVGLAFYEVLIAESAADYRKESKAVPRMSRRLWQWTFPLPAPACT